VSATASPDVGLQSQLQGVTGSYRERTHEGDACVERSKTQGIKQRAGSCHKGNVSRHCRPGSNLRFETLRRGTKPLRCSRLSPLATSCARRLRRTPDLGGQWTTPALFPLGFCMAAKHVEVLRLLQWLCRAPGPLTHAGKATRRVRKRCPSASACPSMSTPSAPACRPNAALERQLDLLAQPGGGAADTLKLIKRLVSPSVGVG